MTLKEGHVMNTTFNTLKDSIQQLKLKSDSNWFTYKNTIQKLHTDYSEERSNRLSLEQQIDTLQRKYVVNKMLYEKRELDWRKERLSVALVTILPYVLLFLIAAK
jgi:hypothetical protein